MTAFRDFGMAGLALAAALASTGAHAALTISKKATENVTCNGGVCAATSADAVLNVTDLAAMLASGDATVQSGSLAKDIEFGAKLSWTSSHRLTLDAYRSIAFNKPIVVAGTGAMTIAAGSGGHGGDFQFFGKGRIQFWDLASNLMINGQRYVLESKIKGLARDIKHNGTGNFALAKSIDERNHAYFASPIAAFAGNFEGLGNTISNLTITGGNSTDNIGLFGSYGFGKLVTLRDVGLISANIDGGTQNAVGALVGQLLYGTIKNSYGTGQVSGAADSFVGGLVGHSIGATIYGSHSDVAVLGTDGAKAVGGLVGYNEGACFPCFGLLSHSYALGTASGGDDTFVGGLVGKNSAAQISNSYATGTVTGENNASVGGLVGTNSDDSGIPAIDISYATGIIVGGSGSFVGGLIGQDAADSQIANSYWDMDTSGVSDPAQGAGNIANDPGIAGLTTEQLTSALPGGFDPAVWKQKNNRNAGYPYLIDNPPAK